MKVLVKEGWVNQDTGKKSAGIQSLLVQYLQDVLDDFAKKLIVLLNISDLIPILSISQHLFRKQGDNLVTFEIMEKKLKKIREVAPIVIEKEVDDFVDENDAMEVSELQRRKPLPC
jgi:DNA polymerase-3 subunit alpha